MINNFIAKFFINRILNSFSHIRDVHRFAFKRYADRIALITPEGSFSYAQIEQRSLSLVSFFEEQGLVKGDYMFALLPDGHEQYEVRVTTTDFGLVPIAFNVAHSSEQVLEAAKNIKPSIFIYEENLGGQIAKVMQKENPNILLLKIGKDNSYEQAIASSSPKYSNNEVDENTTVALGFTSGTTGKPKALIATSRSYLKSLRMLINNLRIKTNQKNIMLVGITLIGAGSGMVLPTMLSGGTLIIPKSYDVETLLPLIEEHQVTRCFMTPSLVIDLLDSPTREKTNLQSLITIIYGTAPLAAAKLEEGILKMGAIFQQGYGMAEVLPPVSLLQMHEHVDENNKPVSRSILSSVGKVVKGVDVRIVDENDKDVGTNEIGEVIIFSPTIFDGYWKQPELSSMAIRNGYMYTSDYGFIDELGYLHILDRRADIFTRQGETVYPRQIEEVIHTHPAVKEATVIEVNNQFILCASMRQAFKNQNWENISIELENLLSATMKPYQIPEKIFIVDELPRSFLGKVLRREIRDWVSQGKLDTLKVPQNA